MADNANAPPFEVRRRLSLGGLYLFCLSAAIGFAFRQAAHDWFVGALAFFAFWIVVGLLIQSWDIWLSLRQSDDLSTDRRWGLRFALVWRITLSCLFIVCFVVRSSALFSPLDLCADRDYNALEYLFWFEVFSHSSPRAIWDSVLWFLIIAAIIGSCDLGRHNLWRPAALVINSLGAIAATVLFVIVLEERQLVSYLIHVTIQGMMMALRAPCGPIPDIAVEVIKGASRSKIMMFFAITTAGVVSVLVNVFLCWELSIRWRRGGWPRTCLAVLLAAGLTVMLLLTERIVFVEVPAISPLMVDYIAVPPVISLAAAVLLISGLATAVAGRWSELPFARVVPVRESWRRASWRYYHERPILLCSLGVILLADALMLGSWLYEQPQRFFQGEAALHILTSTQFFLRLILFILIGQAIFWGWWNRNKAIATDQPRMAPGLFISLWPALLAIVVCSAPIFSAWHFAGFLRSGCFSP